MLFSYELVSWPSQLHVQRFLSTNILAEYADIFVDHMPLVIRFFSSTHLKCVCLYVFVLGHIQNLQAGFHSLNWLFKIIVRVEPWIVDRHLYILMVCGAWPFQKHPLIKQSTIPKMVSVILTECLWKRHCLRSIGWWIKTDAVCYSMATHYLFK